MAKITGHETKEGEEKKSGTERRRAGKSVNLRTCISGSFFLSFFCFYDSMGGFDWLILLLIDWLIDWLKGASVHMHVPSADKESAIRRAKSTDADGYGHEKCQSTQSSTSKCLPSQRESIDKLSDCHSYSHSQRHTLCYQSALFWY